MFLLFARQGLPFFSLKEADRDPEVPTPALHGLLPRSLGNAAVGGVGLSEPHHELAVVQECGILLHAIAYFLVVTRALHRRDGNKSFPVPLRPFVGALVNQLRCSIFHASGCARSSDRGGCRRADRGGCLWHLMLGQDAPTGRGGHLTGPKSLARQKLRLEAGCLGKMHRLHVEVT